MEISHITYIHQTKLIPYKKNLIIAFGNVDADCTLLLRTCYYMLQVTADYSLPLDCD